MSKEIKNCNHLDKNLDLIIPFIDVISQFMSIVSKKLTFLFVF